MSGKEMDIALGSLVPNWAEMLSSFGSYVLANSDILKLQSGFALYNVTDGIAATDISSCISPRTIAGAFALFMPICYFFLATAINDQWGQINAAALVLMMLLKLTMLGLLRESVDDAAHIPKLLQELHEHVKVLATQPNGKVVTVLGPRMLFVDCLPIDDSRTVTSHYLFTGVIFATAMCFHIVALGMSKSPSQIFTLLVLALGTYLFVNQTGATRNMIG
ncbi:hypothetical protein BDW69DRAFT_188915 [Aspergillus filifer]